MIETVYWHCVSTPPETDKLVLVKVQNENEPCWPAYIDEYGEWYFWDGMPILNDCPDYWAQMPSCRVAGLGLNTTETTMNTIQDKWETFLKVIPKDAPAAQVHTMKQAFYAGAIGILNIQYEISQGHISDDAAVQILEGLHCEMAHFLKLEMDRLLKTSGVQHG